MQTTTSDAPLLPMQQLHEIKELAPEQIAWFFAETTREAEFRRSETKRINARMFVVQMATILASVLVLGGGFGCAAYAISTGDVTTATTFGATTIGLLAAATVSWFRSSKRSGD